MKRKKKFTVSISASAAWNLFAGGNLSEDIVFDSILSEDLDDGSGDGIVYIVEAKDAEDALCKVTKELFSVEEYDETQDEQ